MATPSPLVQANTAFSLALLKTLGDNDKKANLFFSPFSISSALSMVLLGARGNTEAQMMEVLRFHTQPEKPPQAEPPMQTEMQTEMLMEMPREMHQEQQSRVTLPPELLKLKESTCLKTEACQAGVHEDFGKLLSELNKPDASYALSVANRLYGEQSYQFVEDFLNKTRKHYNAELEAVDFAKNHEEARININGWVEEQTQGKIKDVLTQGVVDNMTRLVLVNAIYFKGNWNKKFEEINTQDAQFKLTKNETKPVKMMRQTSKFSLASIPEVNCHILEMPYKDMELSMIILLPSEMEDDTTGLEKLETQLTNQKFVEWTRPDMMDVEEVHVQLPRFKMEEKYDMKNVLVSMGMADAFDIGKCNFSGMSPVNDLVLSRVVHKAYVEVNEEGTEAAAATGAVILTRGQRIPLSFTADHPFLFFIRHNPSMSILFAGRYCSPE